MSLGLALTGPTHWRQKVFRPSGFFADVSRGGIPHGSPSADYPLWLLFVWGGALEEFGDMPAWVIGGSAGGWLPSGELSAVTDAFEGIEVAARGDGRGGRGGLWSDFREGGASCGLPPSQICFKPDGRYWELIWQGVEVWVGMWSAAEQGFFGLAE